MASTISITYAPPPTDLGDLVSSLYDMRQDDVVFDAVERADRPQLRVMLSGVGHYHFASGAIDPTASVTLLGPTSGRLHGVGHGPTHVVGAGLMPAAWAQLADQNGSTGLTDRAVDGRHLWGDDADRLAVDMAAAADTPARFAVLCAFIAAHIAHSARHNDFVAIVDAWLIDSLDPDVTTLIANAGLGQRQVERLCHRYYGLPPKMLARKYRALRTAAALARGEDVGTNGLDSPYYDQSHLIREVKRFAGLTPQQIAHHESPLQNEIAEGRKALEGQVSPLVSDA